MDTTTRLRAAREAAKQLQEDLAEASGVPQGTISRIENGTAPQVVTALRLARALGTTVEDLFSDLLAADDEERAKRAAPVAASPPATVWPTREILPGLDPGDPEPPTFTSPEWYAWMERENARIDAADDPYSPARRAAAEAALAAEAERKRVA